MFVKAWQIYVKRLRIGNVNGEKALVSGVSVFQFVTEKVGGKWKMNEKSLLADNYPAEI